MNIAGPSSEDGPADVPAFGVAMVIQRFRPQFTGQGVQLEQLCRALARRGHRPLIITASRGNAQRLERTLGVEIRRVGCAFGLLSRSPLGNRVWKPLFALGCALTLWRQRRSLDVIHVHALTDALYSSRAVGRLLGIPVIFEMTLVGDDDPASVEQRARLFARWRYRVYRGCNASVAMSRALAEAYRAAGLPAERLRLIPQGVDTHRFRPAGSAAERRDARRQLEVPDGGPLVAFVGTLGRRKGIDLLLEAWEKIHARVPQARLLLVGPDDSPAARTEQGFTDRLEALRQRSPNAAARIQTTGVRADPELCLRAADLFVFPSRREGFGSVIIEAMATGLACVVADLPGITDWILERPANVEVATDQATPDGVVVPQNDASALARAATRLLTDEALRTAIGTAARSRALDRFGLDRVAGEYVSLYAHLVEQTIAGAGA